MIIRTLPRRNHNSASRCSIEQGYVFRRTACWLTRGRKTAAGGLLRRRAGPSLRRDARGQRQGEDQPLQGLGDGPPGCGDHHDTLPAPCGASPWRGRRERPVRSSHHHMGGRRSGHGKNSSEKTPVCREPGYLGWPAGKLGKEGCRCWDRFRFWSQRPSSPLVLAGGGHHRMDRREKEPSVLWSLFSGSFWGCSPSRFP